MSKSLFCPILIIFSALSAAVLAWIDSGWALRPYLLFWFILICPGMAVIGLLKLNNLLSEFVLSVALSLVLGTLVAELLLLIKQWSPHAILAVLVAISIIGASLQIKNRLAPGYTLRQ